MVNIPWNTKLVDVISKYFIHCNWKKWQHLAYDIFIEQELLRKGSIGDKLTILCNGLMSIPHQDVEWTNCDYVPCPMVSLDNMLCVYIYIYIKWTVFVNVTTKSAQHAHVRMIAIIVEKVQTQVICTTMVSWIIPIVRQFVNHKKIPWVIHKQQKNYIENHKTHHNQWTRHVTI